VPAHDLGGGIDLQVGDLDGANIETTDPVIVATYGLTHVVKLGAFIHRLVAFRDEK
jgi:hypothetical protein